MYMYTHARGAQPDHAASSRLLGRRQGCRGGAHIMVCVWQLFMFSEHGCWGAVSARFAGSRAWSEAHEIRTSMFKAIREGLRTANLAKANPTITPPRPDADRPGGRLLGASLPGRGVRRVLRGTSLLLRGQSGVPSRGRGLSAEGRTRWGLSEWGASRLGVFNEVKKQLLNVQQLCLIRTTRILPKFRG